MSTINGQVRVTRRQPWYDNTLAVSVTVMVSADVAVLWYHNRRDT